MQVPRIRSGGGRRIATFLGQVRRGTDIKALELRHFEPLTLPGMMALAAEAELRWPLTGLLMIHRTGPIFPGEPIVLVAVPTGCWSSSRS